ncbi:MAG TPA: hypothetical protein VK978_02720 [Candidatus Saccharimonadales bacterium]|nr:hypothetical protein [Candidatus Saccharimonadales bacterium]
MTELLQIVLTAALTIIGGIFLFIFGEFAKVLVVQPLQNYMEHVQLIRDRLDFYSNRVANYFSEKPNEDEWKLIQTINSEFRSAATLLGAKYAGITRRKLLIRLKIIPTPIKIDEAYHGLIFLSNNLPRHGRDDQDAKHNPVMLNHDAINKVINALNP